MDGVSMVEKKVAGSVGGKFRERFPKGSLDELIDEKVETPIEQTISKITGGRPISGKLCIVMNILFIIAVVATGVQFVLYTVRFLAAAPSLSVPSIIFSFVYLGLLLMNAGGGIALIVYDFNTYMDRSRIVARVTEVTLVLSFLLSVVVSGIDPIELVFVFQFACLVFFQIYTDDALARNHTFRAPWEKDTSADRKEYIPLNFFHIFWIFVICCVIGLIIEAVYHAIVFGGYQDRAGLLWGPFSPIYGFGGTLMTVALNRFWNKSKLMVFLVSGFIGAAFEFLTSYFMEVSFGIVAWDYSGTFLNIQGRTNFAFFCAWGLLGLVWIRLLLPDVLKIVDAIPLKLRTVATIVFAVFMLIDCVMTLTTIDCWYQRVAGATPTTPIEQFCAVHFDDAAMADRFQTMDLDPSRADRIG